MVITSLYLLHPVLKLRERAHEQVARTNTSPHRGHSRRLAPRMGDDAGSCRWFEHALGATAAADPAVDRRSSGQDHGSDHHHRHRTDARFRRHVRWIPPPRPDRVRPLDRVCGEFVLPVVFLVRRRSAGLMSELLAHDPIPGFEAPVHRALTEPILLGGAPRAVAITKTAPSLLPLVWDCAFGSPASCCGRSGTWRRSGPQSATRSSSMSCGGTCVIPRISACKGTPC